MSSSNAKKERRRLRHERNILKDQTHKKDAWDSGKIIYENHNNKFFSPEYSVELTQRLWRMVLESLKSEETFIRDYQKIKPKLIDSILMYNPEIPKLDEYQLIKYSLELYWDNRDNMFNLLTQSIS